MVSAASVVVDSKRQEDSSLSAVKTLRKGLSIIDALAAAERALSVAEVAVLAGVTRPTAHRLVQTLVAEGYALQDPRDGRISPGFAVLKLASTLLDNDMVRLESLPHLTNLARECGERASLGILHRRQLLLLGGVEKPSLPTLYCRFGGMSPAHCAALGKAMLAFLPDHELKAYLAPDILRQKRTEATINDKETLLAELAEVRASGLAVDREGCAVGTFGVASPILVDGRAVAAIGLAGRALEPLLTHKDVLHHTAELISHGLSRGV